MVLFVGASISVSASEIKSSDSFEVSQMSTRRLCTHVRNYVGQETRTVFMNPNALDFRDVYSCECGSNVSYGPWHRGYKLPSQYQ